GGLPARRGLAGGGQSATGAIWRSPRLEVTLQPGKIFFRARGVYHQQKSVLACPVNDQVVNDSAALVQQESVLTHADIEFVHVIREHRVEPGGGGALAADFLRRGLRSYEQLSHVRCVEYYHIVSHLLIFLHHSS